MQKSRLALAALGTLAVFVGLGAPPSTTALADPKPADPAVVTDDPFAALELAQVPLDQLAALIKGLLPGLGPNSGYAGLEVVPESGTLLVYWKGAPPLAVRALAARSTSLGEVDFLSAPYDHRELDLVRQSILDDPEFDASGISVLSIPAEGTGIEVGVRDGRAVAESLTAIKRATVPLSFFPEDPVPASRWDDQPPIWGGAAIKHGGYGCSSGFGVHWANNSSRHFVLTAAHCFHDLTTGVESWYTAGGFFIGKSWDSLEAEDAGTIDTSLGAPTSDSGRSIYEGGVDATGGGTGETNAYVDGFLFNNNGNYIRTSGAYTGERSGIKIINNDTLWTFLWTDSNGDTRTWTVFGIQAEKLDHTAAIGQGDSGGPVVSDRTPTTVGARGIISAGASSTQVACKGIRTNPDGTTRRCWWRFYYPDMFTILDRMNLALNQ